MTDSVQRTVKCQNSGDGSGDVVIDLSSDVFAAMNITLGDLLTIELVGD